MFSEEFQIQRRAEKGDKLTISNPETNVARTANNYPTFKVDSPLERLSVGGCNAPIEHFYATSGIDFVMRNVKSQNI